MSEETITEAKSSRRSMLRLAVPAAAGVAALAAAAATETFHAGTAHADDNGNMIIGQSNASHAATWLQNNQTATTPNDVALIVLDWTASQGAATGGSRGYSSGITSRSAGANGGIGVLGINGDSEVTGTNTNVLTKFHGAGVYGLVNHGSYHAGSGVVAHNINGSAPLHIVPVGVASATAPGDTTNGGVYADGNGALWNARRGAWYPMSSVNLLAAPIRILDTRGGQPAPLPASKAPLAGNTTMVVQVTGTTVNSVSVPAGALAVIGNLTVTNTQGGGDLILYPDGAPQPLTSNINFAGGQTVANFAIVGLSSGGAMDIHAHVSGTDVIFDVAGYII